MSSREKKTEQGFPECKYWSMSAQNIINIIKKPTGPKENEIFEFKESINPKYPEQDQNNFNSKDKKKQKMTRTVKNEIGQTICAFLNTNGGIIIIGIHDKTYKIVGIDSDLKIYANNRKNEHPQRTFERIKTNLLDEWNKGKGFTIGDKSNQYRHVLSKYIRFDMETILDPEDENKQKKIIIIKVRSKYLDQNDPRLIYFEEPDIPFPLAYSRINTGSTVKLEPQEQRQYLNQSMTERSYLTSTNETEIESMDSDEHRQRHTKPRSKQDNIDIKQAKFVMSVSAVTIIIIITLMTLGNIGTNWIWLPVILALVTVAFFFPKNNR